MLAMQRIAKMIGKLPADSQHRVVAWLDSKFGRKY